MCFLEVQYVKIKCFKWNLPLLVVHTQLVGGRQDETAHLVCPGFYMNKDAGDTVTNVEVLPDYNLISSWRTLRQKLFSHDHSPLQTGTHLQPAQQKTWGRIGGIQCDYIVKKYVHLLLIHF